MKIITINVGLVCAFLLSSCAMDSLSGDSYSRGDAGMAQVVTTGKVVSVRNVKIQGSSGTGAMVGAIAGGVLGRTAGSNKNDKVAGSVGGAAAGAILGSFFEKMRGSAAGVEVVVKTDAGKTVSIVQALAKGEVFRVGETVRLINNGEKTRVSH